MNINNGFSKNILNIIKKKDIKLKPRWQFLLKDYVIWSVGAIALIIGGLAFSVIIYLLRYDDWSVYGQITGSIWEFILLTLPYFWLLILAVFILVTYYNIKHTKKGYRYSLPMIVIISIVASMVLGVLFSHAGIGRAIDDVLGEKAPLYTKIFNRQIIFWTQPEEGRLVGLVVSRVSDAEFMLLDSKQNEWRILGDANLIEVGKPVKLVGEQSGENEFHVEKIMPVGPGRKFFMRHKDKHFPGPLGDPKIMERIKKYPEFKEIFEQDLLGHKERIKEIMEKDPEFIKNLEKLNIAPEIIEQLQAE